jgi:hypothetical protein
VQVHGQPGGTQVVSDKQQWRARTCYVVVSPAPMVVQQAHHEQVSVETGLSNLHTEGGNNSQRAAKECDVMVRYNSTLHLCRCMGSQGAHRWLVTSSSGGPGHVML